ncbi:unnamed protein product [Owenia fusiformis]|uniref:C2H2-type domain-containing protein n=1 Tax=Owenia fusiformis TaxID=6347 RepID=A0A8S4N8S1_OWEFU|nr:unnamed protein product [Owenia fusiformis]
MKLPLKIGSHRKLETFIKGLEKSILDIRQDPFNGNQIEIDAIICFTDVHEGTEHVVKSYNLIEESNAEQEYERRKQRLGHIINYAIEQQNTTLLYNRKNRTTRKNRSQKDNTEATSRTTSIDGVKQLNDDIESNPIDNNPNIGGDIKDDIIDDDDNVDDDLLYGDDDKDEDYKPDNVSIKDSDDSSDDDEDSETLLICSQCNKEYTSETDLKAHTELHRDNKHKLNLCHICPRQYKKLKTLLNHVLVHHNDSNVDDTETENQESETTTTCMFCYDTIPKRNLNAHIFTEHKIKRKKSKQLCLSNINHDKQSKTKSALRKRVDTQHEHGETIREKLKCNDCEKVFGTKKGLLRHMTKRHKELRLQCHLCEGIFTSKSNLCDHIIQNHDTYKVIKSEENTNGETTSNNELTCAFCEVAIIGLDSLHEHIKLEHLRESMNDVEELFCTKCDKTFESAHGLNRHKKLKHTKPSFKCHLCESLLKTKYSLRKHITLSHDLEKDIDFENEEVKVSTQEASMKCPFCKLGLITLKELHEHIKQNHILGKKSKLGPGRKKNDKTGKSKLNIHTCEKCSKVFHTASGYSKHRKTVCSGKYLVCPHCDKQFLWEYRLREHIIFMHNNKENGPIEKHHGVTFPEGPPYQCCHCEEKFEKKTHWLKHRSVHIDHPFICEYCSKQYRSQGQLKTHIRSQHNGEPAVQLELQKPQGESQGPPYTCKECGKMYETENGLMKHFKLHTGDLYTCDYCGKQYVQRQTLMDHIRTRHTHNTRAMPENYLTGPPYKCPDCPKVFKLMGQFRTHHRWHSGKLFSCDKCDKKFASLSRLTRHVESSHQGKRYQCHTCDRVYMSKGKCHQHMRNKGHLKGGEKQDVKKNVSKIIEPQEPEHPVPAPMETSEPHLLQPMLQPILNAPIINQNIHTGQLEQQLNTPLLHNFSNQGLEHQHIPDQRNLAVPNSAFNHLVYSNQPNQSGFITNFHRMPNFSNPGGSYQQALQSTISTPPEENKETDSAQNLVIPSKMQTQVYQHWTTY